MTQEDIEPENSREIVGGEESQDHIVEEITIISNKAKEKKFKKFDIKQKCDRIIIYESIFSNFLHGELHITDTDSLIELAEWVGEEEVVFKIAKAAADSDNDPIDIDGDFIVYKIDNRKKVGKTTETFILHFTHRGMSNNQLSRVPLKISAIDTKNDINKTLKKLIEEDLKIEEKIDIEEFEMKMDIILPWVQPVTAINILLNSFTEKFAFFYQNRKGFFIKSLEKMLEEGRKKDEKELVKFYIHTLPNFFHFDGPIENIMLEHYKDKETVSISSTINSKPISSGEVLSVKKIIGQADIQKLDIYQIEEFDFIESCDNYDCADGSYYGFLNYGHDILTKTIHKINYNGKDNIENSLNSNDTKTNFVLKKHYEYTSIFATGTNSGKNKSSYIQKIYGKDNPFKNNNLEEIKWPKKSTDKKRLFSGPRFSIKVPGISKLNVGDTVYLYYPTFKTESEKDRERKYGEDKYYSGKYLILEMIHTIEKLNTWTTRILLSTDSLSSSIPEDE